MKINCIGGNSFTQNGGRQRARHPKKKVFPEILVKWLKELCTLEADPDTSNGEGGFFSDPIYPGGGGGGLSTRFTRQHFPSFETTHMPFESFLSWIITEYKRPTFFFPPLLPLLFVRQRVAIAAAPSAYNAHDVKIANILCRPNFDILLIWYSSWRPEHDQLLEQNFLCFNLKENRV